MCLRGLKVYARTPIAGRMAQAPSSPGPRLNVSRQSAWLRVSMLVALLAGPSTASTDQARTTLGVSANVVAIARLALVSGEPELLVTAEDLNRGYIDFPTPLQLTVYSNSRSGYVLDVLPASAVFSSVSVQGLGADVVLPADGGTVTHRWGHPQEIALSLKFSFMLASGVRPGRYPWPVRLAARPLAQ